MRLMSSSSSSRTNGRARFGDAFVSCVPLLRASSRASDTAHASFCGCREHGMRSGDDVRVVGTKPIHSPKYDHFFFLIPFSHSFSVRGAEPMSAASTRCAAAHPLHAGSSSTSCDAEMIYIHCRPLPLRLHGSPIIFPIL